MEDVSLPPAEHLPPDPDCFWSGGELPEDLFGEVQTPSTPAAQLKRLGRFPFWRGTAPLVETLEPVYPRAAARGMEVFAGLGGKRSEEAR